jgi:hypothetical protein
MMPSHITRGNGPMTISIVDKYKFVREQEFKKIL